MALPADRLAMCQAAIAGDTFFEVDGLELNRSGPSYTIDTARQLKLQGHKDLHWLIGADMVISLPTWHQPDKLLAEVNFVAMARPGFSLDWKSMPALVQKLQSHLVTAPLLDISSSQIRERIGKGLPIKYLTPDPVIEYIGTHQLYR